MNEIALAIRVLVALVFLTAAVGKLRHRLVFQGVVANYRLLPESVVPAFALLLPPVEAAVAAALLFAATFWPAVSGGGAADPVRRGHGHQYPARAPPHRLRLLSERSETNAELDIGGAQRRAGLAARSAGHRARRGFVELGAAEALLAGTVLFVLLQSMNILWSVVPAWRQRRAVTTGAEK